MEIMQEVIKSIGGSIAKKKTQIVDYVLLHHYGITPSPEAYKRITIVPDSEGWQFLYLDYVSGKDPNFICLFAGIESHHQDCRVIGRLKYKAAIEIPESMI